MTQIITFVSPFIVSWLGGLIKNHALSDEASKTAVRMVILVLALIGALLQGWLSGSLSPDFAGILSTFALVAMNFLGATGVFHLVNK